MSEGCSYFTDEKCRSCTLLAVDSQSRESSKLEKFKMLVKKNWGDSILIGSLRVPFRSFGSRTKAKLSVTGSMDHPVIGLVKEDFSGQELLNCPLHISEINEIISALPRFISEARITPYQIAERRGEIKGVMLLSAQGGKEMILRVVLRSRDTIPAIRKHLPRFRKRFPNLKVVSVNIQPLPAAIPEGPEEEILTKAHYIREDYDGFSVYFGPQSFMQVTYECARALYREVGDTFQREPARSLLDLYCGVGGFSFAASSGVTKGTGIEISENAIENAKRGGKYNTTSHLSFHSGDVETFLKDGKAKSIDAVIVNPPRRGLSPGIIQHLITLSPTRILYSSCNPETLIRDLMLFHDGYVIEELIPFDMFPLTEHLEVLAKLRKR